MFSAFLLIETRFVSDVKLGLNAPEFDVKSLKLFSQTGAIFIIVLLVPGVKGVA